MYEEKEAEITLKIFVDTTELDEALRKAKELLVTLEKCRQATLEKN